jgi:hypothetical protein
VTKRFSAPITMISPKKHSSPWHALISHFEMGFTITILLASIFLCQHIITVSAQNQTNKIENAELNHIRYGLLSINTWKEQINEIVLDEINKLDLSRDNVKDLKPAIENQLIVLIDKIDKRIRDSNRDSVKGRFKQAFLDIFVNMEEISMLMP